MIKSKAYYWPQWFAASLFPQQNRGADKTLIKKLSWANLYLWRALNLYDDFLDGSGRPVNLPRANAAYRHFLEIYYRLDLPQNFYTLFNRVLTDLDQANREEIRACRYQIMDGKIILNDGQKMAWLKNQALFSNLTDLSRKSLALGLGPMAILSTHRQGQIKIKNTLNFFRLALAAKQLADDAKDWFEDLRKGHLTAANILVLIAAEKRGLNLDLKRQPEVAYRLFAQDASQILSNNLRQLCRGSRRAAAKIPLSSSSILIKKITGPLETGINETEHFRSRWLKNGQKML